MNPSPRQRQVFSADRLNEAGLNRQAIFDLADLPDDIRGSLAPQAHETQLILLGHGGRRLWECVTAAGLESPHPIDDYSIDVVHRYFSAQHPARRYRILYPSDQPIGLQALGKLAGWHAPSPFMIGIDAEWGSWYAYRAVLLADTDFCPSQALDRTTPCLACSGQPCISACPAGALEAGQFALETCSNYRLQPDSPCRFTCLARLACPVGSEHRYDVGQLRHTYGRSLRMIEHYRQANNPGSQAKLQ